MSLFWTLKARGNRTRTRVFFTKTRATIAPSWYWWRATSAPDFFGIAIPTRHAVTFTALAKVVVSCVSSPLIAFPLFKYFAPRLPFVPLWWWVVVPVAKLVAFGLSVCLRSLAPHLPTASELASTAFACFYCFTCLRVPFHFWRCKGTAIFGV